MQLAIPPFADGDHAMTSHSTTPEQPHWKPLLGKSFSITGSIRLKRDCGIARGFLQAASRTVYQEFTRNGFRLFRGMPGTAYFNRMSRSGGEGSPPVEYLSTFFEAKTTGY